MELRTRVYDDNDKYTYYKECDLYLLENLFQLKRVRGMIEDSKESSLFMTTQNAGNCAWRSLMPWLRRQMTPKDYKRLLNDMKIDVLVNLFREQKQREMSYWHDLFGTSKFPKLTRVLLSKSLKNIALSAESQFKKELISLPRLKEKVKTIETIAEWINERNRAANPIRYVSLALQSFSVPYLSTVDLFLTIKTTTVLNEKTSHTLSLQSNLFEAIKTLPLDAHSILPTLKMVNTLIKDSWKSEASTSNNTLIHFITRVSVEDDYIK